MYNLNIHIPQQIENMLSAVDSGNYPQFCNAIDNLKEMIKEDGFKNDIDDYIKKKDERIDKENGVAMGIWKQMVNGKDDFNAVWMTINDSETKRAEKVQTILAEHMGVVKTYILAYLSNVETKPTS